MTARKQPQSVLDERERNRPFWRRPDRPKLQTSTNRPVTHGRLEGKAKFPVVVVVVRTGHTQAVKDFTRFTNAYGLDWEPCGNRDDGKASHGTDNNPDLNANATDEFLVWGLGSQLLAFLDRNTGDGRCICHWYQPVNVRVGMTASGSGPVTPRIEKMLRDRKRPWQERDAREERERLDRLSPTDPDNPYRSERLGLAQGKAHRAFPALFDVSRTTDIEMALFFPALVKWFLSHDHPPTDVATFHEWRTDNPD
jgi:hypothetical protein